MNAMAMNIEQMINQLIHVLDKDIQNIKDNLLRLNDLRIMVIRRDDDALAKLLEHIRIESQDYKSHDAKRQSIRMELAKCMGCDFKDMTLSKLQTILPKEKTTQLSQRKTELTSLVNKLKKEHVRTTLLLSDCARFNRTLLENVFGMEKNGSITYNANGSAKKSNAAALVNLRF